MFYEKKEYLAKVGENYEYRLIPKDESPCDGWIEIPKGAYFAVKFYSLVFYSHDFSEMWYAEHGKWLRVFDPMGVKQALKIVWQRKESLSGRVAVAKESKQDAVNHPSHYTSDPSGIECIEVTRHRNFNIGNAMKYLWRNGLKDSDAQVQDLEKAIWYIKDEIKRLENLK